VCDGSPRRESKVMVDDQVENILSEIRERVRTQELRRATANPSQPNGAGEPHIALEAEASREACAASAAEAVRRIDSYLTVTSRAWDRLPPLASNRSGSIAQIELWIKRVFKRATNWFTWEQINFNAATHHALREILQALSAYEHALEGFRAEAQGQRAMLEQNQHALEGFRAEAEDQRAMLEQSQLALEGFRAEAEDRRAILEQSQLALRTEREEFEMKLAELQAQRAAHFVAERKEIDARISEAAQVMQERLDHLQEEQRVCFRQLSLEATEAAVLEDRARRKTETLLEELRGRIDQLQNSTK
jgi:hypothetical protein